MEDTKEYLPKSRALFRKFIRKYERIFFEDMRNARLGPGTGYLYFYRGDEVMQHMVDIYLNFIETFQNVTIPEQFASPKRLVEAWKWFYDFLQSKETKLFADVFKTLKTNNQKFPPPLEWIYGDHKEVLALMEEILSMDEVAEHLNSKKKSGRKIDPPSTSFDIVIITALHDTEFEALKELPVTFNPYNVSGDSTKYLEGQIGNKTVLLATDDRMGIAAATCLSTKVIAKFSPSYLIMAGIAAGVKDKKKNYGDILIANFTWNYESGKYRYNQKTRKTVFEPNPEQIELDATIVHLINDLKSDPSILQIIHNSFKETPSNLKPKTVLNIFLGAIASGSAVLADKNKIDSIKESNRKLIGIDMETFGVYYAAQKFSYNNKTKAISIKSISDFADYRKNDKFRKFAAFTSAMFIYYLIKEKLQ